MICPNTLIVYVFGVDDWGCTYLDSHLMNKVSCVRVVDRLVGQGVCDTLLVLVIGVDGCSGCKVGRQIARWYGVCIRG